MGIDIVEVGLLLYAVFCTEQSTPDSNKVQWFYVCLWNCCVTNYPKKYSARECRNHVPEPATRDSRLTPNQMYKRLTRQPA